MPQAAPPEPSPLTDGRLLLAPWRDEDAADLCAAAHESFASVGRWLPWCHAGYGMEHALTWTTQCRAAWQAGTQFAFAVRDAASGELLGGCGLSQLENPHRHANLGYWVRASRQRQGIAVAASRCVVRFGFEALGLVRIEIVAMLNNHASRGVAERLGATFEGPSRQRLWAWGRAHDAAVYALIPTDLQRTAEHTAAASA